MSEARGHGIALEADPMASRIAAHLPIEIELLPDFHRAHVEKAIPARSHTCVMVSPAVFAAISMLRGVGIASIATP